MNQFKNRTGLSWTAAAAALGVSRSTIRQWRDKGWLVTFDDGSIDVEATRTRANRLRTVFPAGVDPEAAASAGERDAAAIALHEARRRKMVAEAIKAELELEKMRSELISRSDAERVYCDVIAKARANIEAVPNRCAELLAGLTDVAEVRRIIAQHIEEALLVASGEPPRVG